MTSVQRVDIVGCGDIGRRVATLCYENNIEPFAWVRSKISQSACQTLGLSSQRVDLDHSNINIRPNSSVLYTVPPPSTGEKDTRIEQFLSSIDNSQIQKIVLISTTGVYGDCKGNWVDENQSIQPTVARAVRRADAESKVIAWAQDNNIDYIILRVPGIYATDRLPLKRIQCGAPVLARKTSPWSNRIHADDLAMACYKALMLTVKNDIINISDDAPSTITDYFFAVADYAGLPRPTEINSQQAKQQLSAGLLSYMTESRRLDNDKMKRVLEMELQYPSLKEGLVPSLMSST